MSHYILTRFNSIPTDRVQAAKALWLNEEWVNRRLSLVREYMRPSLEKQTRKDFIAVFACHKDTSLEILRYLKEFAEVSFSPIQDYEFPEGSITTRMDSDDMLCRDFVKTLYETWTGLRRKADFVKKPHPVLVDWDTAQIDIQTGEFRKVLRPLNNSQFVSVIHSTRQRHCYSASHAAICKLFSKQIRIPKIGGLQVIHDSNIFTKKPMGHRISLNLEDFR